MNIDAQFLNSPLFDLLGSVFLQTLWQGLLIALVAGLMLHVVGRHASQVRYAISIAALFAITMIPIMALWQGYAPLRATTPVFTDHVLEVSPSENRSPIQLPDAPEVFAVGDVMQPTMDKESARWMIFRSALGIVWIGGLVVMFMRLLGGWMHVHRLRNKEIEFVYGDIHARFRKLMKKAAVWQNVALLQSSKTTEAILVGWIKPAILLPVSIVTELSTDHIEAIIAHELAHVKRFDHVVAAMQAVIETFLFFHPGVWWLSRQIRVEREHCCDELAAHILGDTPRYARALLELESKRSRFGSYALSVHDGNLLSRIRRLMTASSKKRKNSGYTMLLIVFMFMMGWQVGSCGNPQIGADDHPLTMEHDSLPAHVQLMIDANDIEGTLAYLHDHLSAEHTDILDLAKAVYMSASERRELRKNMVYVFAHINTPQADQVLIHIAENDMLWEVRANAVRAISLRINDESESGFRAILREQLGEEAELYEYPTISESQLKALVPALQRVGLDNMQMPGVRRNALGALRNRADISGYYEKVIATSTDPVVQLGACRYLKPADKRADTIIGLYESSTDPAFRLRALQEVGFSGSLLASTFLIERALQSDDGEASWLAMDGLNSLFMYLPEEQHAAFFGILDEEIEQRLHEIERAASKGYASQEDKAVDLFRAKHVNNIVGEWRRRFREHNFNAHEIRANAVIIRLTDWIEPQRDKRFVKPLFEFTTEGVTTQLYGRTDKGSRELLRQFEYHDVRKYIQEELKARIVLRPVEKKRSADDRFFTYIVELEGYLWYIEVKSLAPYKYGVTELSRIEDDQIDLDKLETLEGEAMGMRLNDKKGNTYWWILENGAANLPSEEMRSKLAGWY